ncbi:MAG: hypothetical protein K0R57_1324 [Paenibacillaceae bacterium]|jgi:hypothetical protein|nr:hypothetical protein [Paenibacillaceae bacterium]
MKPMSISMLEIKRPAPGRELAVNVCDFGASTDSEVCNAEPFRRALDFCRQKGASCLVIPSGIYYFHEEPSAGCYLDLEGFEDFTVQGNGAELLFGQPKPYIRIRNSSRVHVHQLILDWNWEVAPLSSVGVITDIDSQGAWFEMTFPAYEHIPEHWEIKIVGPFDPQRFTPGTPGGIEFRPYRRRLPSAPGQEDTDAQMENLLRELSNIIMGMEKVSHNVMRFYAATPDWVAERLEPGQVYQLRHYEYDTVAIWLEDSRHMTLEHVTLYSCPGSGIVGRGDLSHLHLLHCQITVRPGTDRAISTTADGLHIGTSQGHIIIEHCDFGYCGDDCINLHDNTTMGVRRMDDYTLLALRVGERSTLFRAGDPIEFRLPDLSPAGYQSVLADCRYDSALGATIMTFQSKLPEELADDTVLFNRRYDMRHFIIRRNRFTNNRARGLLIHGYDGIVEHNVFDHIQGAAIQIETGCELRWSEGHGAGNIAIRRNQFRNCDVNAWQMAVLYMGVYLPGGRTAYPIFSHIRIEDNTFVNCPRMAMYLSSCRHVRIAGNAIVNANQISLAAHTYGSSQQEKPVYDETYHGTIYLHHASDVEITDNKCLSVTKHHECGIAWDETTTQNIIARGNIGFA